MLKEDKSSLLLAGVAHLLLFSLFFNFDESNPDQAPTISFNVVTTDVTMETGQTLTQLISKPSTKPKKKIRGEGSIEQKEDESDESIKQNVAISNNSSAIFDAAYLNNQAPNYPSMSKSLQEEGEVLLEVEVDSLGNVQNIKVKESSGFKRLDQAAMKAVKNWQFVAAKKNNQFIASKVQVPINFILE
ncbi:MAG: TonB family protein [Myxococcota bacterium]